MPWINRDSITAVVLLLLCGLFWVGAFDIEITNYGTISSDIWPKIVLALLSALCVLFLVTSVRQTETESQGSLFDALPFNVVASFVLFACFIWTLPYLGMLVGGISFVFLLLTLLGERSLRHGVMHLVIASVSVTLMWATFSYGLGVFLPEGELWYALAWDK